MLRHDLGKSRRRIDTRRRRPFEMLYRRPVNSYPMLKQAREERPVTSLRLPSGQQGWLVTGFEGVRRCLADERLIKDGTPEVIGGRFAASEAGRQPTSTCCPSILRRTHGFGGLCRDPIHANESNYCVRSSATRSRGCWSASRCLLPDGDAAVLRWQVAEGTAKTRSAFIRERRLRAARNLLTKPGNAEIDTSERNHGNDRIRRRADVR